MEQVVRTNNFNVLRLLFAYLVIFSHSYSLLGCADREPLSILTGGQSDFGVLAVTAFFIISGFLITRSWMSSSTFLSYASKRVRRIYPGFIVAAIIALVIFGPLGAADRPHYWADFRPARFLASVLMLVPAFPIPFTDHPIHGLNGAVWSIPWEFGCYFAIPLLSMCGFLRRRRLALALFAAMVAIYTAKHLFVPKIPFPGRIATAFMAGQIFYLYQDEVRYNARLFAVSLALLVFAAATPRLGLFTLFMPVFGAYALLYVAFAEIKPLDSIKPIVENFDISYGVYLYGWPVQQLSITAFGLGFGHVNHLGVTLLGATVLGILSWVFVERVFLPHRSSHLIKTVKDPADKNEGVEVLIP